MILPTENIDPWLSTLPERWKTQRLKHVVSCNDEVLGESTSKGDEIEYVDIGSVSSTGCIENTERLDFADAPSRARRIVRDGDILVSTVRTYLKAIAPVFAPPSNLIASTGFAVIRSGANVFPRFMAYCLRTEGFVGEVISRSVGISYPAINATDLINIEVPVPERDEQKQIAAFLDYETAKIDALIEKQQQLIALLGEKRQAVISHAVTKGLNPDAPMRDSGIEWLGEVPEHWTPHAMKHLCEVRDGTHDTPRYVDPSDDAVPLVTSKDFAGDQIDFTNAKWISRAAHEEIIKRSFTEPNDVLMSMIGGNIGKALIVSEDSDFSTKNVAIFKTKNDLVLSKYILFYLQSGLLDIQISLLSRGGAQGFLGLGDIRNLVVPGNAPNELTGIVEHLERKVPKFDELIARAYGQTELLQERRTALISAAVTGKIDVRGWKPPSSPATPETEMEVA